MFTAEPSDSQIACGTESVMFPCEHKFGSDVNPFWIINNKSYSPSQLPQDHFYDGKALLVKKPKLKQNNTSYQCVIESPALQKATADSTCFYRSIVGKLWITCEGKSKPIH